MNVDPLYSAQRSTIHPLFASRFLVLNALHEWICLHQTFKQLVLSSYGNSGGRDAGYRNGNSRGGGSQPGGSLRKPRWDMDRLPPFQKDFYRENEITQNRLVEYPSVLSVRTNRLKNQF